MTKILLVEDDSSLGATLEERLKKEGFSVTWRQTKASAEKSLSEVDPDLVILDIGLPDGTGFDLARNIRTKTQAPFIFLTALNSAEHRLEGYELGADEYIPKPFHLKELFLRLRHVLEKHSPVRSLQCGGRTIDFQSMAVVDERGGKTFFSTRDFRLLKLLIQVSPRVISRDEILNQLWGEDCFPTNRTIDNSIVRLRQILDDKNGKFIRAVRGIGYQWAGQAHG